MLSDLPVEFSDFALAGLARVTEDESKRESLKAALKFYLRRDAQDEGWPCPAFEDRELYLYKFWRCRVLYEVLPSCVWIWSVSPTGERIES
jgi:hypothetical protein